MDGMEEVTMAVDADSRMGRLLWVKQFMMICSRNAGEKLVSFLERAKTEKKESFQKQRDDMFILILFLTLCDYVLSKKLTDQPFFWFWRPQKL